jgi:hypothetical protein
VPAPAAAGVVPPSAVVPFGALVADELHADAASTAATHGIRANRLRRADDLPSWPTARVVVDAELNIVVLPIATTSRNVRRWRRYPA